MLLKRRSQVDPLPGYQNFWSKSLSEHRFKAQILSKITKIFVSRAPLARGPHFLRPSAPKCGTTPPHPCGKNVGDDTKKSPRTGFSQWYKNSEQLGLLSMHTIKEHNRIIQQISYEIQN